MLYCLSSMLLFSFLWTNRGNSLNFTLYFGYDVGCWFFGWDLSLRDDLTSTVEGFRRYIFFGKAEINRNISSSLCGFILLSSITAVEIIISFEPLNELEVILIFSFGKFLNIDISFDSCFVECVLQYLQVVDELVLVFSSPVKFTHCDFTWVDDVDDLRVDRSRAELFDFCDVQLV